MVVDLVDMIATDATVHSFGLTESQVTVLAYQPEIFAGRFRTILCLVTGASKDLVERFDD